MKKKKGRRTAPSEKAFVFSFPSFRFLRFGKIVGTDKKEKPKQGSGSERSRSRLVQGTSIHLQYLLAQAMSRSFVARERKEKRRSKEWHLFFIVCYYYQYTRHYFVCRALPSPLFPCFSWTCSGSPLFCSSLHRRLEQ